MHRLVLPLPSGYASKQRCGDRQEFSVFENCSGATPSGTLPAEISAYLNDLVSFLSNHRLIQYHPENFFAYRLQEELTDTANPDAQQLCCTPAAAITRHLDQSLIRDEEVHRLRSLCRPFDALLDCRRDAERDGVAPDDVISGSLRNLADLILHGPPSCAAEGAGTDDGVSSVAAFYETTQRLMVSRRRRIENDYCSLTFAPSATIPTCEHECMCDSVGSASTPGGDDVMRLLVDHNMCHKKQHEVHVMRDTVKDLVRALAASRAAAGGNTCITVMNVGEGKGYCSRVLALADGFQVVGLDCNPLHKEGSSGRVEKIVEGRLGAHVDGSAVNLLYCRRGHMASITCRVDCETDWRSVLRGYVTTVDDASGSITPRSCGNTTTMSATTPSAPTSTANEKVQCRICGHILKRHTKGVVLKHCKDHIAASLARSADNGGVPAVLFSRDTNEVLPLQYAGYHAALTSLPQADFVELLLSAFFTSDVCIAGDGSGKKRERSPPAQLGMLHHVASIPRGSRILLEVVVQVDLLEGFPSVSAVDAASAEHPRTVLKSLVPVTCYATIVGYDEGAKKHKLLFDAIPEHELMAAPASPGALRKVLNPDNLRRPVMVHLASCVEQHTPPCESGAERIERLARLCRVELGSVAFPSSTGFVPVAGVLSVLPFTPEHAPSVSVPSLKNVVMIGLHTCGDLGSSICRLFCGSRAAGLVLVSCCWHALTNGGFPLSRAVKAYGLRTESISLMLATQPLDIWGASSSEGHRGSARLLFLRGLLVLLWEAASAEFRKRRLYRPACDVVSCRCTLLPLPHLEPSYLRRMAKVKATVTLAEFAAEAYKEYYATCAKRMRFVTSPLFGDVGGDRLCASCVDVMDELFGPSSFVAMQATQLEAHHMLHSFKPFLGLTVLRMWMSHLVETLLLLDRALYIHEELQQEEGSCGSDVTLAPLFDGALSPRMYGILVRRR